MKVHHKSILPPTLQRSAAFIIVFIVLEVLAVCAAASVAEKLGEMALCPFKVQIDDDPSRLPKQIKQHTCVKSMSRNIDQDGGEDGMMKDSSISCADIGGHCVQVHENIKVTYRHRTLNNHRKHDIRVNMSCVCVPRKGRPATEILPSITR